MSSKLKIGIIIILLLILTISYSLFQIGHIFHAYSIQLTFIAIVLTALWYRKFLWPVTAYLIILHVGLDSIVLKGIPYRAVVESSIQLMVALALYYIINRQQSTVKQQQALLEEEKNRYKAILEATNVGTWEWHITSGNIKINDRWAEMLGYQLDDLIPLTINKWSTLLHPDDKQNYEDELQAVFNQNKSYYQLDCRLRHQDGYWLWIQSRGQVKEWDHQNRPLLMTGTHLDIHEVKDIEQNLNQSHRLMSYIIEHSNAAVAVHDKHLNYVYVSERYLKQYRVKDKDIIGKHHYEVFPDLPQKWRDVHQRALKGEVLSANRDPYPREDGLIDYTRWECRPWYEYDGSIGGIIVYTEVINDQINIEQELETSRDNLLLVMDNLPIGIAVNSIEPTVEFDYMNDNFPKIYGTTKEILSISNSFWEAVYENETFREVIKKQVTEDIASQDPNRMKWLDVPIDKSGEKTKYISAYATPIPDSNLLISTVIDVTDQKTREQEILYISYHDFVTGIPNRRYFADKMEELDHKRHYPLAIMLMDINGLKLINDAFGYEKGNEALRNVANILQDIAEENVVVARIGSDEFAMILPNTDEQTATEFRQKIVEALKDHQLENIEYSLSIGSAIKTDNSEQLTDILKYAEEDMYRRKVLEASSTRSKAIHAILATLTEKFQVEKVHSEKVAEYCYQIGEALGLSIEQNNELKMAGMLHDIGKISTPDHLLSKPSKLTKEEWEIMREHTIHGYNILHAADEYSNLANYALTHHEHYDGSGYPKGLKGEEIPLFSRIICIADAYEAMTADRPYRKALSKDMAISELLTYSDKQFDKKIVETFVNKVIKVA